MDSEQRPTIEEWNYLYQAAIDFKHSACWKWMYEDDVFGVTDPETGEIAFCSIMGNGGEHFAVAGYLGVEGLNGILDMLSEEINTDSSDSMFIQKCLMCSFEDREFLLAEDLKNIKELGLKFRGRNEWPLFRSYEPGLVPWFLNASQCRFLAYILKQALEVALRCRNNKDILRYEENLVFLNRICQKSETGEIEWIDQYITEEPYKHKFISFHIQDEIRIKKLKTLKINQNLLLEADTFYVPTPVREKGRPYYPKVCVLITHHDGMAVAFEMIRNIEEDGHLCIEMLANFIAQNKQKPAKLLVEREETYYLYQDVCKQLGLIIETEEHLENLEEFRFGMLHRINDL